MTRSPISYANLEWDEQVMDGVTALVAVDVGIAVDVGTPQPWSSRLLPLAAVVRLDARAGTGRLSALAQLARDLAPDADLLAEQVDDAQGFTRAAGTGARLFAGSHLRTLSQLSPASLTPEQLTGARLIAALADGKAGPADVEPIVASDPALTLRVLRAASSAATGVRREITSLRQALVLLGPRALVSLVMLTSAGSGSDPTDSVVSALARAQFCQDLAELVAADTATAYTVGLLSGLADLLHTDAAQVASSIGVGEQVRVALVDHGGPEGGLLLLAKAHEEDDQQALRELLEGPLAASGMTDGDVSIRYLHALNLAFITYSGSVSPLVG